VIDRLVDAGAPVARCCRILGVARQNYYKHRRTPTTSQQLRREWLTGLIREVPVASCGTYGYRRVHAELTLGMGIQVWSRTPPRTAPQLEPVVRPRAYGPPVNDYGDPTLHILNREVLGAYGWPPFGGMFDIRREWPAHVPCERGVYAFVAAGDERITYPIGESSIVYFGKAEGTRGLRQRVGYHRGKVGPHQGTGEAWERYPGHPAHEWILTRGGFCLYSVAPDGYPEGRKCPASPKLLEFELITAFQRLHRTRPVGNGTSA